MQKMLIGSIFSFSLSIILLIFSLNTPLNIFTCIFSIFIFLSTLFFVYKTIPELVYISGYMLMAITTTLIISIFLEYGIFLIEIGQQSYAINLPSKALIQVLMFFLGMTFSYIFFKKSTLRVLDLSNISNYLINKALIAIILIFISILLLIAVRYGVPFQYGIHRNDYWAFYAPSWGGVLVYLLIQLNFVLGLLYSQEKNKVYIFLYLAVIACIILMGERMTGLVYSVFFFFLPFLVNKLKFKVKISFHKKILISFLVVSLLSFTLYKNFSNVDVNSDPKESILMRASLQPQMWWGLDLLSNNSPKDLDLVVKKYLGIGESDRESGTYYLMDQVSSKSLVDARFETQSKFTMSGFFNHVYYFGYWLGALLNFLWGAFFGFLCYLLYLGIKCKNIIYSFISFKFLYKVQALFLVGSITDFFTIGTLVFSLICMFFLRLK
ncbi:hypothetical protein DJ533_18090 [Acinetobacter defluvii]|uniref:DUF6418 domain-containing protein n=1 Tax=Acinetobacter defluvii TaxID=1871111 RepID=A0A2S2FHD5_9GAMM|nr:DUF6418 domain-containing protein [Acinetobacter defluvii]AWL30329.1 hypothetical protein DJ533_18090 [Acinetobacter defluvii]